MEKKIEIKVSGNPQTLPQPDWQCVVRASNMFREHGYEVTIVWNAQISQDAA